MSVLVDNDDDDDDVAVVVVVSTVIPGLTLADLEEWASLGPTMHEKPSSTKELQAQKERKQKRNEMKKRLLLSVLTNLTNLDGGGGNKNQNGTNTTTTSNTTTTASKTTDKKGDDDSSTTTTTTRKISARTIEVELDRLAMTRIWEPLSSNDDRPDYQKDNGHPDNTIDYRSEGGPLLQYLWAPEEDPIQGQSMYLGGEVGSDGNIYCIPGHASRVLQIDTTRNIIQPIGPILTTSDKNGNQRLYKWLRGIVVGDIIYGLPCHADEILKINVVTHEITKISIPYEDFYKDDPAEAKAQRDMIWKYHGGNVCPIDNNIYAIPQRAHHVLKFDPTTETASLVGPALPGHCKWYGGIVGKSDGAIYGIPQNAAGVLRITPTAVTVHGDFGAGNHKWHGGAAAENGVIVSVPANADTILCITPAATPEGEPQLVELGRDMSIVQSGRHRDDGKYKYLGAMAGTNGKVYVFPCASEYVLQVDTVHMIPKNVGPNLRDTGMESVYQNKWQNGLTCRQDQCVYGMPLSGHTLLRIDCSGTTTEEDSPDPIVTTWKLPSPRIECRDKFEGGVVTDAGVMYTVPNNHKGVLRIEPPILQQH